MFENLITLAGTNEALVTEINVIKTNYEKMSSEVSTQDQKLKEVISKRDQYKDIVKTTKSLLGFKEDEQITSDNIKSVFETFKSNKDENALKEIKNLEDAIKEKQSKYEQELSQYKNEVLNTKLELELHRTTAGINAVNAKAHEIIVAELKKGATFNGETISYLNEDGTIARQNGLPISLSQKLESIKASEDFGFLFKADNKSGSGMQTSNSQGTGNLSKAQQYFLNQAKQKGISVNLS